MVLKIRRQNLKNELIQYKSTTKRILTPKDIEQADRFDDKLMRVVGKIEKILLKKDILSKKNLKKDPLQVWFIVGSQINKFLKENTLDAEDENSFWENLYGRSTLINSKMPSGRISLTRNDFKTASLLALYPFKYIRKVGSWALWREIITYRVIVQDKRILEWIIDQLLRVPRTRDEARPLLKSIAARFKRIDTAILNSNELRTKLEDLTKGKNKILTSG